MSQDFVVNYSAGGDLDKLKSVKTVENIDQIKELDTVNTIEHINEIKNFPIYTQPYNEMVKLDIPALIGTYPVTFVTPNMPAEILALTVTCSGYDEEDYYDLFVGEEQWFRNWYLSEVKEGLFLGTSTFVYKAEPNTEIRLEFHNVQGTSKKCWLGVRMLVDKQQST